MKRFQPAVRLPGRVVKIADAGPVTTHDGDSFATHWVLLDSGQRLRVVLDEFGDVRKVVAASEIVHPEETPRSAGSPASDGL